MDTYIDISKTLASLKNLLLTIAQAANRGLPAHTYVLFSYHESLKEGS